jgi:hypothetical protein
MKRIFIALAALMLLASCSYNPDYYDQYQYRLRLHMGTGEKRMANVQLPEGWSGYIIEDTQGTKSSRRHVGYSTYFSIDAHRVGPMFMNCYDFDIVSKRFVCHKKDTIWYKKIFN